MSTALSEKEVKAITGALPIGLQVVVAGSEKFKELKQKAIQFFQGNGCEVVEVCNLFRQTGSDIIALQHLINSDLLYVVTGNDSTDSCAGEISKWLLLNAKVFGVKTAVSADFTLDDDFNFINAIVAPEPCEVWGDLCKSLTKDNTLELRSIATAILERNLYASQLTQAAYTQELCLWGKPVVLEAKAVKICNGKIAELELFSPPDTESLDTAEVRN